MIKLRVPLVLLVVTVVGAACGGGGGVKQYGSAQELARALAAHGFGCGDFRAVPNSGAISGELLGDAGVCSIKGGRVAVAVFRDAQTLQRGVFERIKGCVGRRAVLPRAGGATVGFASGPTWMVLTVGTTDAKRAADIAKALHATAHTVAC